MDNPLRVAICSNTALPIMNGVAVSIGNHCDGLAELGWEVDLYAPAPPRYDRGNDPDNVFRFPSFVPPMKADYPIAIPYASKKLCTAFRTRRYDIVHTHHPWWVGSWARWYAEWMDVPIITTIHTQYEIYCKMLSLPSVLADPFVQVKVRSYCNAVDLVTTPGAGSKLRLEQLNIQTPIEVVSNPTKLESFWKVPEELISQVRRECKVQPDEFLIGYVGRLSPEKNLGVLIEAFGEVSKVEPRAKLMIVGDGPAGLLDELKALADKIAPARVVFTGRVNHDQIAPYYAAMDLFLTPSMSEVQPMTFAEAFATGTPIVCFDVPGCNDMVSHNHNGLLVDPLAGIAGLAGAVLSLIRDRLLLVSMSKTSREWAHRYEQMVAVKAMIQAYHRTIRLHGQRRRKR